MRRRRRGTNLVDVHDGAPRGVSDADRESGWHQPLRGSPHLSRPASNDHGPPAPTPQRASHDDQASKRRAREAANTTAASINLTSRRAL